MVLQKTVDFSKRDLQRHFRRCSRICPQTEAASPRSHSLLLPPAPRQSDMQLTAFDLPLACAKWDPLCVLRTLPAES